MSHNNNTITSITSGPRQSNFELLRIIAMLLVLITHANYMSLGAPTDEDIALNPLASYTRIFIQSATCICVNLFICISGWFEIKTSLRGFCKFAFQILYFFCGIYLLQCVLGGGVLNFSGIAKCFVLTSKDDWFIKAYIGLYVVSPILNVFLHSSSPKIILRTIVCLYIFQTIYGCTHAALFIRDGYSVFSFCGLYLLSNYMSRYYNRKTNWLLIFIICTITNFFLASLRYSIGLKLPIISYINPIMVLATISLTMAFANLKLKHNKILIFISSSSFAAYLIHAAPGMVKGYFIPLMQTLYESYSGIQCLSMMFIAIISIFLLAIILDQPRIPLWEYVDRILFKPQKNI